MVKQQTQSEEVSQAIDAVNQNLDFYSADPEVRQLADTALSVKRYGRTDEDTALISQLAGRIHADLAARRRRKRLMTAIGGVAAAALLFAGVSIQGPPGGGLEQAQTPSTSIQLAAVDKSQPDQAAETSHTAVPPQAKTAVQAEPPPANKAAGSAKPQAKAKAAVPAEPSQRAAQPPAAVARIAEPGSEKAAVAAAPSQQPVLLVLPDRPADTVSTEAGGTVRQIYGKNSEKEIIVTQRAKRQTQDGAGSAAGADAVSGRAARAATTAAGLNKATRQINGVEVTVEGSQPQEELEKVAASLIPVRPDAGRGQSAAEASAAKKAGAQEPDRQKPAGQEAEGENAEQ